jgi:hypothetical protein
MRDLKIRALQEIQDSALGALGGWVSSSIVLLKRFWFRRKQTRQKRAQTIPMPAEILKERPKPKFCSTQI